MGAFDALPRLRFVPDVQQGLLGLPDDADAGRAAKDDNGWDAQSGLLRVSALPPPVPEVVRVSPDGGAPALQAGAVRQVASRPVETEAPPTVDELNRRGIKTPRGGCWHEPIVKKLEARNRGAHYGQAIGR